MFTFNTVDLYVENFVEVVENPIAIPFLQVRQNRVRHFFLRFLRQKTGKKLFVARIPRQAHPSLRRGNGPDRGLALLPYFLFIRSATTRAAFTPDAPA